MITIFEICRLGSRIQFIRSIGFIIAIIVSVLTTSYGMERKGEPTPQAVSVVQAKDCDIAKRNLQPGEIPSGYVHCTIPQQIKYYREKVYDIALKQYKDNVEDLKVKAIPGLSVVLENAFSLVHDYIINDQKSGADKNKYFDKLRELWNKAKSLEGKLTSSTFQHLNLDLAEIIDCYKKNTENLNINREKIRLNDDVVFIIYGNPNPDIKMRHISTSHFVEQFCLDPYSAYIAFFDVLSMKTGDRTRKDPHWSMENGTSNMLLHDLRHIYTQIRGLTLSDDERDPNIKTMKQNVKKAIQEAYDIQKRYKNLGQNNEATILINGLFILLHEMPMKFSRHADYFESTDQILGFLKKIYPGLKAMYLPDLSPYGSQKYKEENRDWELILKDKYMDIEDNKIKPVHDKDGTPFLPIDYDPELKKMTRPFGDISPLGDTEHAQIEERQKLMGKALQDGYSRFWDYFIYLVENAPK